LLKSISTFLCVLALLSTSGMAFAQSAPSGDAPYHLGPGDKVRVTTYGETELSGEFNIGASGSVALPLVGEVGAAGETPAELERNIEQALKKGYLNDPHVTVEVLTYRPFYILGEVNKPGEYPYSNGLTVYNAVAIANGFTYRANKHRVYIRSKDSKVEKSAPLTTETIVSPGDTIRIGERYF
jgi:polysaccharide export outer membrane protein